MATTTVCNGQLAAPLAWRLHMKRAPAHTRTHMHISTAARERVPHSAHTYVALQWLISQLTLVGIREWSAAGTADSDAARAAEISTPARASVSALSAASCAPLMHASACSVWLPCVRTSMRCMRARARVGWKSEGRGEKAPDAPTPQATRLEHSHSQHECSAVEDVERCSRRVATIIGDGDRTLP
jgi:hypothetical protein